ncbi:vitamin K epoxide reductase complex subunit 1-like protein 1 [Mercenaria mercenaria]|uniref:vitamin K epoxide reductase complex subunit 1-like protein 1 n=1 Tax=Mercenaria mercenaria TaxID=6596 RepID=UPI001E1DB318|nr:vitamin K epoxide reductase complex subunit 1-like protein 1 [Mercenaria mercenaria]
MKATAKTPRAAIIGITVTCVFGILLSIYAYHVEASIHSDPSFRALCDISEKMSCSKVFNSRYGTGFGLLEHIVGKDSILNQPNSVFGVIFYVVMAALATNMSYSLVVLQLITAIAGGLGSVYLAYILVFILGDFCVVCVSTYTLNFILIVCSLKKYNAVRNIAAVKKEKNNKKKAS